MKTHLEDGLFRLCSQLIDNDEEFKAAAVNRNFDKVDNLLFREYRLYRLKKTIKYAYVNSKFYRELFDKNNINPDDINSMTDLEKIPLTSPKDITGDSFDFLCLSQGKVEKPVTFYSGGTTGLRKRIYFSMNDIKNIKLFLSVGMNTVTGNEGIIQVIMQNSQERGIGSILAKALKDAGMEAYATDMMSESSNQIQDTIDNKANIWFGDTRIIYRITKEMEKKVDLKSIGLKILFLTVGYVSNNMKRYLEESWNCRVVTHYGLTEMGWGLAVDCEHGNGFHYNELDVIAEIIDPITGKTLPDGSEGELVFTSLGREAMPLIRYRSRDIATLTNKKCSCGHDLQTMGHVKRRIEAVLSLEQGAEIYPTMFDEILYDFDEIIDYNIYIDKKEKLPQLIFKVEVLNKYDGLEEKIVDAVNSIKAVKMHMIKPKVELLSSGALKEFCYEKKMFKELK